MEVITQTVMLGTSKVSLGCQAHPPEPVWHCVEMLAPVLGQTSHSSAMPIISMGDMSHTAVGFGQRGEAADCGVEETKKQA